MGTDRQGRGPSRGNAVIAQVLIDSPLPHLDRPFDYILPESLEGTRVGTRVRVPFAGRLTSAVVWELAAESDVPKLKPVRTAATMPTFTQEALDLAQSLATRYGGTRWDVLRLMAPARVASVEKLPWGEWLRSLDGASEAGHGTTAGVGRALWAVPPDGGTLLPSSDLLDWALEVSAGGRSAIVVVPDSRAVTSIVAAAGARGLDRWTPRSPGTLAVLDADDGPRLRYASFLAASLGLARIVIGTRSAAWQPVPTLGGIAVWDEASSTYQEPRSPYPHSRTVAAVRADASGASVLIAGRALSAEAVSLAEYGFARLLPTDKRRDEAPAVTVLSSEGEADAGGARRHWLPPAASVPLAAAAASGVAALLVPQAGFAKGAACTRCGEWAACSHCGGTLRPDASGRTLECAECDDPQDPWFCKECTSPRWQPRGLGVERIALQAGRMFPKVPVHVSAATHGTLGDFSVTRGLVVATPGSLPQVEGGYQHLAIIGARVVLAEGLGAETAAVRRWLNAAALVRGRTSGGAVTIVGDLPPRVRQALIGWDGLSLGQIDLAERTEAGLPPFRRSLRLTGEGSALDDALAALPHDHIQVARDPDGLWVLAPRSVMPACVEAVRTVARERSASNASPLHIRVDATPGTT